MAQNPFNPAANTANMMASMAPQNDQFANFSSQNNPFNPQPPKPANISNVSGNQFKLNMAGVNEAPISATKTSTAESAMQPVAFGVQPGQTNQNPAAAVVQSQQSPQAYAPQSYSPQSTASAQQTGLIRGAVRPM
jgi:hypothetical protein